jgi:tripartite-type tricarboxylate transporter receptor subunit TctC
MRIGGRLHAAVMGLAAAAAVFPSGTPLRAAVPAWPTQTVRFIVPVLPGGGVDVAARLFAEALSVKWKQTVVVENRAGADGVIGTRAMLASRDGHTLMFSPSFVAAGVEILQPKLPYDPAKDLIPIAGVTGEVLGITVPVSHGPKTFQELVERARAGRLTYSAPPGVSNLLAAVLLKRAGTSMTYVPYRSIIAAMPDLSENRIQMASLPMTMAVSQVRAGKLRVLAVSDEARHPLAPGVPTFAELGHDEISYLAALGVYGPKSLAPALRDRIAADLLAVAKNPKIDARLHDMGFVRVNLTSAEFAARLAKQRTRWSELAHKYRLGAAR